MTTVSATELARNLKQILDRIEFHGQDFVIIRNNSAVAHITAGAPQATAIEAMSDLYRTISDETAESWVQKKSRLSNKVRNPWDS